MLTLTLSQLLTFARVAETRTLLTSHTTDKATHFKKKKKKAEADMEKGKARRKAGSKKRYSTSWKRELVL
jgi:hypothetical protein